MPGSVRPLALLRASAITLLTSWRELLPYAGPYAAVMAITFVLSWFGLYTALAFQLGPVDSTSIADTIRLSSILTIPQQVIVILTAASFYLISLSVFCGYSPSRGVLASYLRPGDALSYIIGLLFVMNLNAIGSLLNSAFEVMWSPSLFEMPDTFIQIASIVFVMGFVALLYSNRVILRRLARREPGTLSQEIKWSWVGVTVAVVTVVIGLNFVFSILYMLLDVFLDDAKNRSLLELHVWLNRVVGMTHSIVAIAAVAAIVATSCRGQVQFDNKL